MSRTQGKESDDGQSPPKQQPATSRQMSALSTLSTLSMASKTLCRRATSWRYRMALLLHFACAIIILLRMNISLALVCMTGQMLSNGSTDGFQESDHLANSSSPDFAGGNTSVTAVSREFDWDSSIQGLILSSGGFITFLFPMFTDALCRHMGSKLVMTSFIFLSGALTLLNPLAARISPYFLIVLRVAIGATGGIAIPLSTDLFSWWSPESEKVTMAALAYAGINVGNILVGAPSGYMCSIPIANGWPFIFYVHGAFTILWCVVWHLCASEKPEDHPFISEEEKTYIIRTRFAMDGNQKKTAPPYLAIATSKPVWGFFLVMTSHTVATMIIFSYMPKYIASVFQFDSEQVGIITSVSYVSRILGVVAFNFLSNSLFSRTHLAKTTIRKVVQCSGFFLCAACLLIVGFLTSDIAALLLLNIIMIGQSCSMAAAFILPLDLAPRYAGFISAVLTSVAGIVSIPGPIIAGLMTPEGTREEWRNVFILMGASFAFGAVVFLLMGSSELQPWAVPPGSTAAEEERRPVTSELINRRMTIMSTGPPLSPKINQTSFRFDASVDYNFQSASYTRDNSLWPDKTGDGRQVSATSNDVTRITVAELEELSFDDVLTTAPDQGDSYSNSLNVTRTDVKDKDVNSKDYVNPGFVSDPDVITSGEEQVENKEKGKRAGEDCMEV